MTRSSDLVMVEARLKEFIAAFDAGCVEINSQEIDRGDGTQPHPWHEEWLHHARTALQSVEGGVQVAAKQESCPESAPRTETAIVTALRECQRVLAMMIDPASIKSTSVIHAFTAATAAEAKARAALSGVTNSAPASRAPHNSGERDPVVMPDCPGADTKSDGGCNCSWGCVEADNCLRKLGPLPDWKQDQSETSRIKPRPSDPSPGPDVKPAPIADSSEAGTSGVDLEKRVADLMWAIGAKDKQILELSAALSAPVGEPVAWQYRLFANGYWLGWCICSKTQARHYRGQRDVEIRPLYTHPPAPAVGPDVREALGESSQTLEYLRREARTWGKIFSVNVDHVLDKNRKALSALTRPLGGFVQGSIATKQVTDETAASVLSEPPEAWTDCETCGGEGAINRTIHVYENGCGFSHPDLEIVPCTDCMGTGGAIVDATSTYCDICGGDCSSANPPVFNCPLAKQESCPESAPRTETAYKADRLRFAVGFLAKHAKGISLSDWDKISNDILDAAKLLDAQLTKTPSADHDAGNLRGLAEPNHHQPHAVSQGWREARPSIPSDGFNCIYLYEGGREVGCLNGPQDDPAVIARANHWVGSPPSPATTGGVE